MGTRAERGRHGGDICKAKPDAETGHDVRVGERGSMSAGIRRWVRWLTPVAIVVACLAPAEVAYAAPSNDDFGDAEVFTGAGGNAIGTNVDATSEPGEPRHTPDGGGRSIWYRWTADASGSTSVELCESDFDTVLAVYTGTAVDSLSLVTDNDDGFACPDELQSAVTFEAVEGVTYSIAVDGFESETGRAVVRLRGPAADVTPPDTQIDSGPTNGSVAADNDPVFTYSSPDADVVGFECALDDEHFAPCPGSGKAYTDLAEGGHTFRVRAIDAAGNPDPSPANVTWTVDALPPDPPPNDDFADAQVLVGASVTVTGTNFDATSEPGEPNHALADGGRSIWYRWTAGAPGPATIDLCDSDFDTALGVYTGSAVNALALVTDNDDGFCPGDFQSAVTFEALEGVTYSIAVDGFEGETGDVVLRLNGPAAPDSDPPVVTCESPGSEWHGDNVSIACTASDAGSGLADPSQASFELATTVPDGTETNDAQTGSVDVCDVAGNCTTVGPITGIKVDQKAPTVTLTTPADGAKYSFLGTLFKPVRASYTCADTGSGIAECSGDRPDGAVIPTGLLALGHHTFTVTATDAAGNQTSVTHSYQVTL